MTQIDIDRHDVVPMAAKKVRNVLRVLYFMLRKEISRRKLMSELNILAKRGKIAGKAIVSLMTFSHHAAGHNDHGSASSSKSSAGGEYEFSCSSSPVAGGYNCPNNYLDSHFSSLHVGGKLHGLGNRFHGFFGCAHLPKTSGDDEGEAEAEAAAAAVSTNVASFGFDDVAVKVMIEAEEADQVSEVASPMLPGFWRTPLVRQLRITDSPFPLKDEGDGGKVDKAAEEFIQKFYRVLQKQKSG